MLESLFISKPISSKTTDFYFFQEFYSNVSGNFNCSKDAGSLVTGNVRLTGEGEIRNEGRFESRNTIQINMVKVANHGNLVAGQEMHIAGLDFDNTGLALSPHFGKKYPISNSSAPHHNTSWTSRNVGTSSRDGLF